MSNQVNLKSGFEVNHFLSENDFQHKDKIDNFKYETIRNAFDALNKNENTIDPDALKNNYNLMKNHNQINMVDQIVFESIFAKTEKNESNSLKKYDDGSVARTIRENNRSFELYEYLPEDLKAQFSVCKAIIEKNPQMYEKLSPKMQEDLALCIVLMRRDPLMFNKLPPKMQENESLCLILLQQDLSMFTQLSTTMQNTSSVQKVFQLFSKNGGLWEVYTVLPDKDSQGYIYKFALDKKYDYINCNPNERDTIFQQNKNKCDDMFPASQISLVTSVLMNKSSFEVVNKFIRLKHSFEEEQSTRKLLLELGFSISLEQNRFILTIPDQRTLEYRLNQLGKTDSSFPKLKFQECNGIATDQEFIEKLVITELVDAIISTDKEFIHDMTIHVIHTILRCNNSKNDFLKDMQQFREICKYYYDKIQKFEALQKNEKNSLNLTYSGHSLSVSEIAKLAYFSLSAFIDLMTAAPNRQEFHEKTYAFESFVRNNADLISMFLDSRHRQNKFVNIEADAFKLVWEHIDKHISMKETH